MPSRDPGRPSPATATRSVSTAAMAPAPSLSSPNAICSERLNTGSTRKRPPPRVPTQMTFSSGAGAAAVTGQLRSCSSRVSNGAKLRSDGYCASTLRSVGTTTRASGGGSCAVLTRTALPDRDTSVHAPPAATYAPDTGSRPSNIMAVGIPGTSAVDPIMGKSRTYLTTPLDAIQTASSSGSAATRRAGPAARSCSSGIGGSQRRN